MNAIRDYNMCQPWPDSAAHPGKRGDDAREFVKNRLPLMRIEHFLILLLRQLQDYGFKNTTTTYILKSAQCCKKEGHLDIWTLPRYPRVASLNGRQPWSYMYLVGTALKGSMLQSFSTPKLSLVLFILT